MRKSIKGLFLDKEEEPHVSAAAVQALATAAPDEAETRLLLHGALQDQRSLVRLSAARALWSLKAPAEEVLPVLTALLSHKLVTIRTGALNLIVSHRFCAGRRRSVLSQRMGDRLRAGDQRRVP